MKNLIGRNAIISKSWHEIKEARERWCARRGRIANYIDFIRSNRSYIKRSEIANKGLLWSQYNDTWDAIAGISLRKRSGAAAAPPSASASASPSAVAHDHHGAAAAADVATADADADADDAHSSKASSHSSQEEEGEEEEEPEQDGAEAAEDSE